jgi:hypothetical protein
MDMSKGKRRVKEDQRGVRRILEFSDEEFEKWMDSVEKAGIKLKS